MAINEDEVGVLKRSVVIHVRKSEETRVRILTLICTSTAPYAFMAQCLVKQGQLYLTLPSWTMPV
jgi:hypothetical protein